jgi:hypothetical protein
MSGLAVHITDARLRQLADPLRQTAAAISSRMGYPGPYFRQPSALEDGHQLSPVEN